MPQEEEKASIWRWFLLQRPEPPHHSRARAMESTPKPTSLLVLNMDTVEQVLLRWQVAKDLPLPTRAMRRVGLSLL